MKLVEMKCKNCGAILKVNADIVKIKSNQFDKAFKFEYKECHVKMYLKDNKVIYLSSSNLFLVFYNEESGYIDNISNCYTN